MANFGQGGTAVRGILMAVLLVSFTPEQVAQIERVEVGDSVMLRLPASDGCNTCECAFTRTGEDTVRPTGWCLCTLLACPPPEIHFREPPPKEPADAPPR